MASCKSDGEVAGLEHDLEGWLHGNRRKRVHPHLCSPRRSLQREEMMHAWVDEAGDGW